MFGDLMLAYARGDFQNVRYGITHFVPCQWHSVESSDVMILTEAAFPLSIMVVILQPFDDALLAIWRLAKT
jgi:hypothetical protein